jgi:hypothetical protein
MSFWSSAPGNEDWIASRRKLLLTAIIAAAMVIMSAGALTYLSPAGSKLNLWFIFPAACAMAACYLAWGLVSALIRGKVVGSLHSGIQALTLALLFGLLIMFFPNSPRGSFMFGLVLALSGFLALAAFLARAYSDHYWLVGRAAVIVMLGLALELGVSLTSVSDMLRGIPLIVAVLVASLSMIGILQEHSNPYARFIGRFFRSSSNMIMVTVVLTLVFVYALKLRNTIAQKAPEQTVLAEWIVVAIVVIVLVYKFFSFFRSKEKAQEFSDARRLVQSVYKDWGDTGYAQRVVDQFIVDGRREPLVVLLTSVLAEGRTDPAEIERIIGGVVGYSAKDRRFSFSWAMGDEMAMSREERTRIAFAALDQTARALGAGYLMSDRASSAGIVEG